MQSMVNSAAREKYIDMKKATKDKKDNTREKWKNLF